MEELWYMVTHFTIKMTFLIFYIRLSPDRKFRITCFATMGLNTVFMIINWLLALLQCIPLDAYFHPEAHPNAKCIDKGVLLLGPSILVIPPSIYPHSGKDSMADEVFIRSRISSQMSSSSSSRSAQSGISTCLGARRSRLPACWASEHLQ